MAHRHIPDETVELNILHRLESSGHDADHVAFVPEPGRGTADHRCAGD